MGKGNGKIVADYCDRVGQSPNETPGDLHTLTVSIHFLFLY